MDDYSFGIAMGQKWRAEGAEKAVATALETIGLYKARVKELELELAVEKACSGAATAQIAAFAAAHPISPLRADSGKRYRSGNIKSVGAIIYEAAFDRIAKAAGIANPAQHRAD